MSDQRMCVISLGVNSPSPPDHPKPLFQDFSRGLARIKEDLLKFNFQGDFIPWDQSYPEGSPTQQQAHCDRYFVRNYQEDKDYKIFLLKSIWHSVKRLISPIQK